MVGIIRRRPLYAYDMLGCHRLEWKTYRFRPVDILLTLKHFRGREKGESLEKLYLMSRNRYQILKGFTQPPSPQLHIPIFL